MIHTENAPRALIIIPNSLADPLVLHSESLFTEESGNTAARHSLLFLPLCLCVPLLLFSALYSSDSHWLPWSPNTGMPLPSCSPLRWMQNFKHGSTRLSSWAGASPLSVCLIQMSLKFLPLSLRTKPTSLKWKKDHLCFRTMRGKLRAGPWVSGQQCKNGLKAHFLLMNLHKFELLSTFETSLLAAMLYCLQGSSRLRRNTPSHHHIALHRSHWQRDVLIRNWL